MSSQYSSAHVGEGVGRGGKKDEKEEKNVTARKIKEGVRFIILTQSYLQYISVQLSFFIGWRFKTGGKHFHMSAVLWIWTTCSK